MSAGMTPGCPGFRFHVEQPSKTGPGGYMRKGRYVKARRYAVYFVVEDDLTVRHSGGVAPTPETVVLVEKRMKRFRDELDIPCMECLVPNNCYVNGGCLGFNQNGEDKHGKAVKK